MGIQLVSVKCPECGASLDIEENRKQAFCTYCGTKILVHNENEQIYRHIDEAGIKKAETEQMVRLKQMEIYEKKRAAREKTKSLKIIISIILGIITLFTLGIGYAADADSFYISVEEKFRSAGFTNIKCIPLNDLRIGVLIKPNLVDSITINGNDTNWGKKYAKDAKIIISYHSIV